MATDRIPEATPPAASEDARLGRRRLLAAAALAPLLAESATQAAPLTPALDTETIARIGLFINAPQARIGPNVNVIRTDGYARAGIGAATYIRLRPTGTPGMERTESAGRSSFLTADGTRFILAETRPTPQMFGAVGDGKIDDAPAFAAMLAFAREATLGCTIPVGTYRLSAPLEVRGRHDNFPWHSMDLVGEQMDGVVLLFDYDGQYALRINDARGSYSGMAGARIGCFTLMIAEGRRITQPVRVLNLLNGHVHDIRIRADWHRLDDEVELFRVSAATQWSRFTNILVDPYNAPEDGRPGVQRGTGISIGHGYRDVPLQSSAISNNSFHDCTVNRCKVGFLSESADATTTYNCRMVACHTGWNDRSSYATVHVNPWDEGATRWGFVFESARVADPNGVAVHKTQFPQIVGGYVGSVLLAGVTGADIRCALNLLEVTAEAERCRAVLLGQNGAVVRGAEHDCHIDRFDTARQAHIVSTGRSPLVQQTPKGGELRLDDAPDSGFSLYGAGQPLGRHAGFREEIDAHGSHRSYVWDPASIGHERRVAVRRVTPAAHFFATPVLPEQDSQLTLGRPDLRWQSVHLATGPVVTSELAVESVVGSLPDLWLDIWGGIGWVTFTLQGDADRRRHAGLIAQDIATAFSRRGISPNRLGLLERHQGDEDAAPRWGIRYDQCQAIEAAWQRRQLARLTARLERLERE